MGKIDPLTAWVQQSPVQALIAAAILLVFCALLVACEHQQRRLTALQTQLDRLRRENRRLESLLVRSLKSPKVPNGSSSDTLQEKITSSVAPTRLDEKSNVAALYVVAPKASPE